MNARHCVRTRTEQLHRIDPGGSDPPQRALGHARLIQIADDRDRDRCLRPGLAVAKQLQAGDFFPVELLQLRPTEKWERRGHGGE